jgi:hypothetical protein
MKETARVRVAQDDTDLGGDNYDIPSVMRSEAVIQTKAASALRVLEARGGLDLAEMLGLSVAVFLESEPQVFRCDICGRDDFKGHKGLSNHDRKHIREGTLSRA